MGGRYGTWHIILLVLISFCLVVYAFLVLGDVGSSLFSVDVHSGSLGCIVVGAQ